MTELLCDQMIGAPGDCHHLNKTQNAGSDVEAEVEEMFHGLSSVSGMTMGMMMLPCNPVKGK